MIRLPFTKIAIGQALPGPMTTAPIPAQISTPAPMVTPAPVPGISSKGNVASSSASAVKPRSPAPGAPSAFKLSMMQPTSFPPIHPHQPRVGLGYALHDTGKDIFEGFGNYTLDVLGENEKATQRPNDPRVMARTGTAIV